jgi:hypothetical protein
MFQTDPRLEALRAVIRDECISYGEIAELESLAYAIEPGDVELLEWAGVPEDHVPYTMTCGTCGRSWDDSIITGVTPTPSGRCPFESMAHKSGDKWWRVKVARPSPGERTNRGSGGMGHALPVSSPFAP